MAKLHKSGHWFFHDVARQPEADELVATVLQALSVLDGLVENVSFDPYQVAVGVNMAQRMMGWDRVVGAATAIEQALGCPLRFVRLEPHQLTLAVLHPKFEGQLSNEALRWLPSVSLQDWMAQMCLRA